VITCTRGSAIRRTSAAGSAGANAVSRTAPITRAVLPDGSLSTSV
jgi:hypothetical protein